MRELDHMAINASRNEDKFNQFILQNEGFILKCASKVSNCFVSKNDDEWSISLTAFMHAVREYNLTKGSFYSFAELIITRRLIDYFRTMKKHQHEISVDPILFNTDSNEATDNLSLRTEIAKQVATPDTKPVRLEIESITKIFESYGFTFIDLTSCSPKSKKTKAACAKATVYLLHNPLLINELKVSKLLPLKIIEKNAKIPRKLLERHRKYIIAAVEILSGEYPILADYLWYIREELNK
jgi:RNA polymerase sigma factor